MISAQIEILAALLHADQQALEAITFDEALVRWSGEIEELNAQRIVVRSERKDLPKRRDEYRVELKSLASLATEIGWGFEKQSELIERVPSRSKVKLVRELLTQHEKLTAEQRSTQKALDESQDALQDKRERLNEIGEATDVSRLAAVLDDVREIGDVADRICREQRQVTEISCEIDKKVRLLRPALPAGTDIEALAVPPRDMVVAHRDDVRDWARRQGETKQQLTEARNNLERDQKALERRVRDEGVVGLGAVEEARGYRDRLWQLVKAQYIACSEIPAEEAKVYTEALEDLPVSLEVAVEQADGIADRRFDKAKAAAELVCLEHNIAGYKTHIRQLEANEAALKAEWEQQDQAWQALWAELPIEVLAPSVMLAWLEARGEIVMLIGREREVQLQLDNSRREEQKAIAQVHAELTKLGWDSGDIMGDSLGVVVKMADAYRQKQEVKAQKIVDMCEAVQTAKSKVAQRQSELERAEAERKIWQADWDKAVAAIDLQCDDKPEVLSAQINAIDQMREHAVAAKDLRDKRIATIERDIEIFARAVAEVAAELAPDLMDGDADASVVALDRLREEALKLQQQHRDLTEAVARRRKKIKELEESRKAGWTLVQPLRETAGVEGVEELREAIKRSDRLRTFNGKLADVMKTLNQQGDGLVIKVIEEECRDVDIDTARARKEAAEAELEELNKQKEEAVVAQNDAKRDFKEIGGDDGAAKAAADCEEALADMQYAAERYVRVRASEMLLRWAVDRYRKEKRGPLLRRAGELFRVLTRSSFERLEVTFDEREAMHLTGVRPDGKAVKVSGLSTGTEDQLFLSLRIAAVEDYLARAVALPFVADDLFINFDQERSASGFEVLGRLSERTQVLFYTHHQHLVDVARETLGADVNVVMLAEVKKRAPKEA
ncbi:MAG: DNA double-strand break repair Rad50 ATPase [Aphanocapsa feldmannii 277cV]|uniref:DNA double-strand break repair Rad50 ATPase n=1 Tax=Aphanocapsa feldmannii 277cV TaxID=2507553 RepID=A0A524RND5_9CHRO|nr:MAG: DNA double-strand break repair Rad50 ATPase [Aphanocapsa feldmannii 277cV]